VPETSETSDLDARNIRDMQVTDLPGRHRVAVDHAAIGGLLTGRRVLVTCAGGEIGSELCRQIQRYDPAELMMLDHDEAALLAVQLSVDPRAELHILTWPMSCSRPPASKTTR
jgi:FlaA1/EpsC-like NDP-sugar epimerase